MATKGKKAGGSKSAEAKTDQMEAAVEAVNLDTSTLVGGLRDGMLEVIKHRPKPWDAMLEDEQRDVAAAIEYAAKEFVSQAVALIRSDGKRSIKALLKSYADKGEITVALTVSKGEIESDPGLIGLLHGAVGKHVVITKASAEDYKETGGDAATDADAPEFDMDADSGDPGGDKE